ncbi:MAG: DUF4189 domain-containing protein [Pseudomonadota bacterium]
MKSLILVVVLVASSFSMVSAEESESFKIGVVSKPGDPITVDFGDPEGGTEHPKTSDALVYGATAINADPLFLSFIQEPVASRELAVEEGWKVCEANNVKCDKVVWFQYGCGARATGADNVGAGISAMATLAQARHDALGKCKRDGGKDCEVRETFCAPKELK